MMTSAWRAKHETHEICLSAAVSINNKGDELHALLDVIGVGVLSLLGVVGIPDDVGLGLSFAVETVRLLEVSFNPPTGWEQFLLINYARTKVWRQQETTEKQEWCADHNGG